MTKLALQGADKKTGYCDYSTFIGMHIFTCMLAIIIVTTAITVNMLLKNDSK